MKHSIIALAILAAGSASGFEGNVTIPVKGSQNSMVVHTGTVSEAFVDKNGKTYATSVTTLVKKDGTTIRGRMWFSCSPDGGEFGQLDIGGKPVGEINLWVLGGNTVGDDAGLVVCHTAMKAGDKASAKTRM